jgi:hypothetical protein
MVRFVIETEKEARKLGLVLRLVGTAEIKRAMGAIAETAALPFFASVDEAKAAA